ncbi:MAG: FAD-dependent oxidoreductase [bacterium]|jgi:NADH dehydrogenase|nr:FAD-dependent oxidoreductase [bacterium]
MSDVVIVGGGFAGVCGAASAARAGSQAGAGLSITLVSPGDDLVIRPRLYEPDPARMRVPLDRVLEPIGVQRVPATVLGVDTAARTVTALDRDGRTREFGYGRLILATGSHLRRPDVPGAHHLQDVDTVESAADLERHLDGLPEGPGRFTAVVVGAGFTGVEVATELVARLGARASEAGDPGGVRVVLVEREGVVGPELGPGPRPVIEGALERLGVEVRLGETVAEVTAEGVRLGTGEEVPARTVVWTVGMQASALTSDVPGRRDGLGRLHVDEYLRVPESPDVLAAGDTAAAVVEEGHVVMQSCQHAMPLGKHAGHNAASGLLGLPLERFSPLPYSTCLDLGPAGAVTTAGWGRTVQMPGTDAKERKRTINQQWIYPPLDDREAILRWADLRYNHRDAAAAR